MGSAASVVPLDPAELHRVALQLTAEQREKLRDAVAYAQAAQDGEIPFPGEQVLELWEKSPYEPSNLVDIDGQRWLPVRFDKVNEDGSWSLRHRAPNVPRENVRRYPQGMRPPEIAGITLDQLWSLYGKHRDWLETPKWNPYARKMQLPTMYDVVPKIVKPATASTKGSYAELFSQKAVDVFVSHWWGHEFKEFVMALEHAAQEMVRSKLFDRDPESLVFWICSFANAQWTVNLGQSLETSPFERALASRSCKAVVMVMDEEAMPLTRIWCIYEVLRTSVLELPFYVATKDGVLLGQNVHASPALAKTLLTLADKLLKLQPTEALASNEEDRLAIVDAVADSVGVPQFALAVQSSLFGVLRQAGYALFSRNWSLNFRLLQVHRAASREVYWLKEGKQFRSRSHRDKPPEKRSGFHRAAQEGNRETLKKLLQEDEEKWKSIEELKKQIKELAFGDWESGKYRRRLELEQQQEVLMNQIHARSDELGQQALHLAARYSNPETIQFLAGLPKPGLHERDFLGRLPLHRAAESGDGELLAALAAFHKPEEILQELDKKQQSTLDLAVLSGSVEALHALNINASSVPERQKRARTPLHLAAQWNHTDVLECLASLGFAVDAEDADLTRPVHLAARFGHRATVAALLGLHADITATTSFGRSALHWAALNGHTEVAEDLLAFRCPLDVRDRAGWTPLHWTLRRCHASCSRSLLEGAADVELVDLKNQRSMLHTAACFNVEPELIEELEAFLTHTATDVSGKTPLHLSAQWGKLLDLKSDLEVRCSHQRTPLYLSARRGNASVSDLLLRRRAELHAADANGVTPLFAAARHGHFKVVLVLVSHQADLTSTEKDGMTAMHWAAKHGNSEAIRELVASVPTNPFALVEATTRFGRSPLHVACIAGKDDAVRVLLDLRSDPAQRQKDGWMPIHLAARFGHEKVIKAMIEAGCDPNVAGVYGKTAAHCLVQREKLHLGFNELPLDVLEADHGGRNVWHLAAALGHTRYFNLYVLARKNSQGCKYMKVLFSLDAKGRTPLHLAAEKGQHLVVKQILSIFLDEEGHFEPRWDLKETYYRRKEEAALEDLLHDEQPPAPPLMADHRGRLPIHLAAEGGFAQVTGMLAKFMLAKQGCTVEQLEVPDLDGFSPLQLALRKKHWEAARRLATWIGREVPELRQVDVQMARRTPLGTKVRVKEDITLESGETLTRGDQGLLESCNETGASLKFDFVVTMSPETFALRCVAEKSYLLNGSCWRRRAKRPFPCLNRQSSEPTEPLMLEDCDEGKSSFSEGDVTRGFDEGTGWLRLMDGSFLPLLLRLDVTRGFDEGTGWLRLMDGSFLPLLLRLDETRLVPALTLWNGPSLKCGQLVRTREAFVQSRATVPPGCVGLVRRIEEEDCATVDFEGQDRRVRVTGPAFFKLQLLPYVTIMEEPKGVPKQGTVVKWRKKEQCGEVVHDGAGSYSSLLFRVHLPDGSKSIKLSERRGLREIALPPTAAELGTFVRLKEAADDAGRPPAPPALPTP